MAAAYGYVWLCSWILCARVSEVSTYHMRCSRGCSQTAAAFRSAPARGTAIVALLQQQPPGRSFDGARRWLYRTLLPLDRGDFRWEFLVPWTNKTLTSVDKFIVCSTFIGSAFTLQSLFDPGASVGVHLSYIAQFFSYAIGNPIGFRLLAVITAILEIVGNLFEEKSNGMLVKGVNGNLAEALASTSDEDVFPIFYDQFFIFINAYYILRWWLNRENAYVALGWSTEEEELYTNCFAGLGFRRSDFAQLLRSASFMRAGEACDTLTVQGEPVYNLYVPLSGPVEVRVAGVVATTLPPYQLVGEASLLENLQSANGEEHPPARATVVAPPNVSYVSWPQSAFYELQAEEDSDLGYTIQLMIARALSAKLREARLSQKASSSQVASTAAGEPNVAGASDPVAPNSAAAAEVSAMLSRSDEYERRILSLERALASRESELADLKMLVLSVAAVLGIGLAGFAEFTDIPAQLGAV